MQGRRGYTLQQLHRIRNPECDACILHESAGNVCIMGRGNPIAPIMIVGEAPGEHEADSGLPFMGLAGQYLDEVLAELGMTHMVYITNPVKCRPPGNRQPKYSETNICTNLYFEQEVTVVNPTVMVLCGRVPINYMFGGRLAKFRRFELFPADHFKWWICPVVCGWHPSYIRRCGFREDLVREFKSQFTIARDYVEGRKALQ